MKSEINQKLKTLVAKYVGLILVFWSAIIAFSLYFNIQDQKNRTLEIVNEIAHSSFNKDQAYRLWATSHGGVYVQPTEKTPPSPWMAHLPNRDITTTEGTTLTLMNPAYMLREMMEDYSKLYGIKGRISGIVYLNPNNKANEWEEKSIKAFEKGATEVSEVVRENNEEFYNLMKPMIMNEGCQKCHGHLGFKNGSVRGGVSVSVPMKTYRASELVIIKNITVTHIIVWIIGVFGLLFVGYMAKRQFMEREKDLDELKISSLVFDNTIDSILITNAKGTILRVNDSLVKLTGYSNSELLGNNPNIFKSNYHDKEFYLQLWKSILENGFWEGEIRNKKKNGDIFITKQSISVVYDSNDSLKYIISISRDITEQKESEEKIKYLAHYDVLTQLPNRVLFYDRFNHALKRCKEEETQLALLFIDLDGFKKINDAKGHPVGDELLKEITRRLQSAVRQCDTVARLGGDEFTIIIEEFDAFQDLVLVIEHILTNIAEDIYIDNHKLFVSASIGISIFPNDGKTVHTLIKHADTAMYKAKENGKNRFCFYEAVMTKEAEERMALESSIRGAINNNEFVVYYQPKLCTKTNRVVGMEALVRWQTNSGKIISPDKFIPIAEELNIIDKIDMMVLTQACMDTKTLNDEGYDLKVSVNLSGYNITQRNMIATVLNILDTTGLEAKNLEFEITETYLINFDNECLNVLKKLNDLGIKLSIDDFGTGYSSLNNLKNLPVQYLKIDKSFVDNIHLSISDETIVKMIIEMAHSLNLGVIAEGVELKEQIDILQKYNCDTIQGYYFSKPLSYELFKEKVVQTNQ
jgi:diguanylate cyclase (GGDEF)-like protein/PAS domain S-box-containing protein